MIKLYSKINCSLAPGTFIKTLYSRPMPTAHEYHMASNNLHAKILLIFWNLMSSYNADNALF